ncbi:adenylate/guanylate cyclase domain-containing protein [Asanoa iriomotensis]|uniref:adenylate/guanylate cyclase domain-containing protein n=1 Tax=Asanoa iriomotensis TaxID=234613 RepID=UPI0035714804
MVEGSARAYLPPAVQPVRAAVWALHLALPLAGLWLLLAQPTVDLHWQHPASHFWLVLVVAGVNIAIGVRMAAVSAGRADARLFLVALAFLTSAGFFLLHALATPGVLVDHPNVGFELAQPVGLTVAAVFAAASALDVDGAFGTAVLRHRHVLQALLTVLIAGWGVVSVADLPPLKAAPGETEDPLAYVAAVTIGLYAFAALAYYRRHRRRPAAVLLSVITAFALLAEATLAVVLARRWQLSWWEWHLLLALAFGFVAYSAYVQYRREGSSAGLFDAISSGETNRRIRAEYTAALEDLVTALRDGGSQEPAARLGDRFGLTEGQVAVLDQAGAALAAERDLTERLGALVAVGEQARVGLDDARLLRQALDVIRPAYGDVRIGLFSGGALTIDGRRYTTATPMDHPTEVDGRRAYPLTVKGRLAGVLVVPAVPAHDARRALLDTLASQLSIALENARLYRELGTLFRQYLSPDVAAALLADPDQAALGGDLVEVTALFADLRGFTTFSEGVEPAEIVRMLNRYHAVTVPAILDNGGTVVQFVGDALLALFNAPARQPDHALRAVRAGLALQTAVDEIATGHPEWPRFRVGANTGPALVGNIGSETLRGFNAMGDAVNVAARLQTLAEPGQVVIGETTLKAAGASVRAVPLGDLDVKGRIQTVRAYVVTGA